MDMLFPFGLPLATAFYLTAYVVTLAIHVVFMNYVLAGTAALALGYFRSSDRGHGGSTKILKEWMPLMLSGAITAGVAPLLFVQILYKQEYYTANLLLFNRWMAILPVLIIGFYALYLLKSDWLTRRGAWIAVLVATVPILCVSFTGYSWTENHLLSVRTPAYWGQFYATRAQVYTDSQLVPRLLVWAFGSIPTMVVMLAWQHWYRSTGHAASLALGAIMGLVLTGGASCWYYLATDDATRGAFVSPLALPYFIMANLGLGLQILAWLWLARTGQLRVWPLILASSGLMFTVSGMTVCREAVRIAALGTERFEAHYPIHTEAFAKGGIVLFLLFFAINGALTYFVFWLVRNRPLIKPSQVSNTP
ncbi:MAG: hypothetical protein ACRC8S_05170 [Fimbriiglobus sp.]